MPTTTEIDATLNINAIGDRTDFSGAAIADLSAEEIRFDQVPFSEGVLRPFDGYEVNAGGGGTMDVIVGSGAAKVDYAVVSGDIVGQGDYVVRLDDITRTITLTAADPSQDRIDEIWLVVLDDIYDSSTKALPILAVREGDVGGGAPGPDSNWQAAMKLATVTIGAGISDITQATITDERVYTDMAFASGGSMPVGGGFLWFTSIAPPGHILARGQLEDPTQYPRLFDLWGTMYGGDGSTTFGVPDLRQRFPLGRADSGTGSAVGDTGGAIDHVHSGPSHVHSGPSHVHSGPSHSHQQRAHSHVMNHNHGDGSLSTGSGGSHGHGGDTGNAGAHDHTGSTGSGGGHSHSFSDSFTTGTENQSGEVITDGAESGVATINHTHSGSVSGNTSSQSSHNHGISSVSNHSHSIPSQGNHSHGVGGETADGSWSGDGDTDDGVSGGSTNNTQTSGTADTGSAGTGNTGSAGTSNTGIANPPYLVVEYAIRAA